MIDYYDTNLELGARYHNAGFNLRIANGRTGSVCRSFKKLELRSMYIEVASNSSSAISVESKCEFNCCSVENDDDVLK